MIDLISRQAAIKAIEDLQDCYNGFSDTYDKACIIGVIEEVPSIEQAVRCKNCGNKKEIFSKYFCETHERIVPPDFYCAYWKDEEE